MIFKTDTTSATSITSNPLFLPAVPEKNDTLVKVNLSGSSPSFVWLWYGILKDIPTISEKIQKLEGEKGDYFCNLDITKSDLWYFFQKYIEKVPVNMMDSKSWEDLTLNMKIGLNNFEDIFKKCKNQPCGIPITDGHFNSSGVTTAFVDLASKAELSDTLFRAFPSSCIDRYISHYIHKDDLKNSINSESAFATIFLRSSEGISNFGNEENFSVNRSGDLVPHTLLKLLLPPLPKDLKWKTNIYSKIINSIKFTANELVVSERTGSDNLNDVESSGLWPKYINCYNKLSPEEQYIASSTPMYIIIPLMMLWQHSSKQSFPAVSLPFNELRITIKYGELKDLIDGFLGNRIIAQKLQSKLECDYILLHNNIRVKMGKRLFNYNSRNEIENSNIHHDPQNNAIKEPSEPTEKDNKSESDRSWLGKMMSCDSEERECLSEKSLSNENSGLKIEGSTEESSTLRPVEPDLPPDQPSVDPLNLPSMEFPVIQHQHTNKSFINGKEVTQVPLRFSHKISGLILTFSSNIIENLPPETIIYPFNYAEILFENTCRWSIHAADARDYLWRKCGRKPPKNQHSFLIPFSPEMFNFKKYPIGPDFSRLSNVSLNIYGNEFWEGTKWNVEVAALTTNVVRIHGGSMGFPIL